MRYARGQDADGARTLFLASVKLDSTYPVPRFNLGRIAEREEQWADAARWYHSFLTLDDTSSFAAVARERLTAVNAAAAADAQPDGVSKRRYAAHLSRARELVDEGDLGGATAELDAAIALMGQRPEAYVLRAVVASRNGEFAASARDARHAASLAPLSSRAALESAAAELARAASADSLGQLGGAAMASGQYERASTFYLQADHLDPQSGSYRLRAGRAKALAGDLTAAESIIQPLSGSKDITIDREATASLLDIRTTRSATAAADDAMADERSRAAGMRAAALNASGIYSEGIAQPVLDTIQAIMSRGHIIKSLALGRDGSYAVLYDRNGFWTDGVPRGMSDRLWEVYRAGGLLKSVAMDRQGSWAVLSNDHDYKSWAPQDFNTRMTQLASSEVLNGIALGDHSRWAIVRGTNGWSLSETSALSQSLNQNLSGNKDPVSQIALFGTAGYVVVYGSNGWAAQNAPPALNRALHTINLKHWVIRAVAATATGQWLVISTPQ